MITLVGPGGAGKSTVGALIAERLEMPFVDLDHRFRTEVGDISDYITQFGYRRVRSGERRDLQRR